MFDDPSLSITKKQLEQRSRFRASAKKAMRGRYNRKTTSGSWERKAKTDQGRLFETEWTSRCRRLLRGAAERAAKKQLPFNITSEHLEHLAEIQAYRCAVTGIPLDLNPTSYAGQNPWAPSVDQINPGQGYTWDNVRLVCVMLNTALGNHGIEAFTRLATAFFNPERDDLAVEN